MIFERRNQYQREQYDLLVDCLVCKGNKWCDRYIISSNVNNPICGWYRTILNDQEKLKSGEGLLTFPLLEKILEDKNK